MSLQPILDEIKSILRLEYEIPNYKIPGEVKVVLAKSDELQKRVQELEDALSSYESDESEDWSDLEWDESEELGEE